MFPKILQNHWYPVVASEIIRFWRSLRPFQVYTLYTKLSYWDDKWIYIEQRFESQGKLCASGIIKGVFKKGRETIPTDVLIKAMHPTTMASPPLPPAIKSWQDCEDQQFDGTIAAAKSISPY
jgi:hypothetical protein